jgi:hypothetical protein
MSYRYYKVNGSVRYCTQAEALKAAKPGSRVYRAVWAEVPTLYSRTVLEDEVDEDPPQDEDDPVRVCWTFREEGQSYPRWAVFSRTTGRILAKNDNVPFFSIERLAELYGQPFISAATLVGLI